MLKFFLFSSYILNVLGQNSIPIVGASRDENNCLISAGYTWCEIPQSCIRQWETPCSDNFSDCEDCLTKQRKGMNIACPDNCDMIATDPIAIDPMPPVYYPSCATTCGKSRTHRCKSFHSYTLSRCNVYDVRPDGNQLDDNGCQICQCNDPSPQSQDVL